MTKTENYQLPQWEANDPVRREDFNEAMASIDAGIADRAAPAMVQQLAALQLEKECGALGDTLVQSANRLLNPLTSADMADELAGAEWDAEKHIFIGHGPEVERTVLREHCTNYTHIATGETYNAANATALYEFTSPLTGTIVDFDLRYYMFFGMRGNDLVGGRLTFTAEELQGEDYVTVYTKAEIPFEMSGTTIEKGVIPVPVEVPLQEGFSYRLTLHLDSGAGAGGNLGFTSVNSGDDSEFTILSPYTTQGSHTRTLTTRGRVSHAVALLHYWQEENTGGAAVSVDGTPMEEVSHTQTTADGVTEHEVWFFGSGAYSETPELAIALQCDRTDRLALMQYGVLLM